MLPPPGTRGIYFKALPAHSFQRNFRLVIVRFTTGTLTSIATPRISKPNSNDEVLPPAATRIAPIIHPNVENVLIEHYDKAICWKKNEAIENYFHLDDVADDEYFIADPYNSWKGPASNMALYLNGTNKTDEVLRMFENFKNSVRINIGHYSSKQNQTMINITNKLVSKGFAADILAQYYNVDIRDVIAFGDEMNDLELLQNVGYGVAMKNGNDNLKTNARGITHLTNDEGGVGDYLEKLLNGENV
ncbi:HAD-IIB family hydrolase [Spiroplasma poulsonii]|uniref:HAD-IIB family hydrolase n=1 Tax=Spiroplasma poulsonii TaxID=2138 RepID=UPI001F4D1726|nr:HAD-IIB family hydrolase [Spiroplasma poulsonii]UNF62620.1 HAD-IIB family hydrolase [Spiroplasma poulsonii]